MSHIRKVVFWIVGGVALVIVGLGVYPWWPVVRDSFGADPYVSYLEANRVPLDLSLPEAGFAFPNEVYASRLIMLGEVHGYAAPQQLDLALLRHLSTHAGVRWYLAEVDPAQAMAVNAYIAGGDSAAVAAVFDRWADQSAQWGNREFFNKLTGIRAMNAALPPDRQVRFIGVDAPQGDLLQRDLPQNYLAQSGTAPPSEGSLSTVATAEAINAKLAYDSARAPGDASRYDHILRNIETVLQMDGARDETFYGLWGKFHTLKIPAQGADPLAMRLNAPDGLMPGGVTSITTLCASNCFNMMPAAAMPPPLRPSGDEAYVWVPLGNDRTYFYRTAGIGDLLTAMGQDDVAMFALGSENTPYRTGQRLIGASGVLAILQGLGADGSAAEAVDYMIGMRNVAPLTPWRGGAADVTGEAETLLESR